MLYVYHVIKPINTMHRVDYLNTQNCTRQIQRRTLEGTIYMCPASGCRFRVHQHTAILLQLTARDNMIMCTITHIDKYYKQSHAITQLNTQGCSTSNEGLGKKQLTSILVLDEYTGMLHYIQYLQFVVYRHIDTVTVLLHGSISLPDKKLIGADLVAMVLSSLSKGVLLCHTARAIGDCNHWILRQTSLLH